MILPAIFLLSLSALAFEILLTRIFSIGQWNHLSFMVISIALFGFGAGGTFLSLLGVRKPGWKSRLTSPLYVKGVVLLYSVAVLISFSVLNLIPLDYFRLPVEPVQTVYLFIAYLLLAVPFFFTGMVISLAYAHIPESIGRIYLVSMAGSAAGAILPYALIPLLGEGRLMVLIAIFPLWLILTGKAQPTEAGPHKRLLPVIKTVSSLMITTGVILIVGGNHSPVTSRILDIHPSPYKGLSHVLQYPDTAITETRSSLRGRIDHVKSSHLHFAPGLSLKYTDALPEQSAVFRDGDDQRILYHLNSADPNMPTRIRYDQNFAEFTLSYAGYRLLPSPDRVLLIQRGGGIAIPCALSAGAGEITVIEQNPQIAGMISAHYDIPVITQNTRGYLAASQTRFDVIHVENWGSSLPGSAALNQEYLCTIEAFSAYLNHLKDNGVLIVSRRLHLPASDIIRLWGTAFEGLRGIGLPNPEQHIHLLRNWDTFALIVSIKPLPDNTSLKRFVRDMNFDWVFGEGIGFEAVNRYNQFDGAVYHQAIMHLAQAYQSGKEDTYYRDSLLDVAPQSDSRPFPNRFLKWSRLKDLYRTTGSRFYALFVSGEIVVSLVFLEALLLSALLLIAPLHFLSKRGARLSGRKMIFFFAVGVGFMCTELYFIKTFILLFGDPIISFTIVLTGLLVFSGVGGFCSQWIGKRFVGHILGALVALLVLLFWVIDDLTVRILGLPIPYTYLSVLLLLLPPGILVGLPFTLGMRHLLKTPVERAYAWAVNGCASVLAAIASAQIALNAGVPMIIACAIVAYALALLSFATAGKPASVDP